MKNCLRNLRVLLCATLIALCGVPAFAQYLRTSYFMDGVHFRQQMNPALNPERGYINFPVVGSINGSVTSNSFGYQDMLDIVDNSSNSDYFMSKDFMDKLNDKNKLNFNLATDILGAGWYKGKNFWNFNLGFRFDMGAVVPKSVFQFMQHMNGEFDNLDKWNGHQFAIGQEELHVQTYLEAGVGFSRQVNEKLNVGGRAKVLLGVGNVDLNIKKMDINMDIQNGKGQYVGMTTDWGKIADGGLEGLQEAIDQGIVEVDPTDPYNMNKAKVVMHGQASIDADAELQASFKGLEFETNQQLNDNGEIVEIVEDVDFDKPGLSGWGLGIDLGASYKLTKNLTVSASVLDLGFVKWNGKHTQCAKTGFAQVYNFDSNTTVDELMHFAEDVSSGEIINFDVLNMQKVKGKDRTTALQAKMVFGAEYSLFNEWLVIGALSTTHFTRPKALTEFTVSANIRPSNAFNFALSYSLIQSRGKSFGLAAKLGPVFIGTDYMFFGKENTKCLNAYLGLSIPLNKRKG